MADIRFNDLTEKLTPVAVNDETLIIDSEDTNIVKRIKATQYKWPKWDTGPQWPTWPQGLQWPTWPQGPIWPAWPKWVNWKWTYNNTVDYIVDDAVEYNGSSYIMHTDAPAWTLPTDTNYWSVLAQKWADWIGSWDMLKSTYDTNNSWIVDDSEKLWWQLPSYYEPAFTKNTGFNLNLWTTAWTVSEWNHTHSELHTHSNKTILDWIAAQPVETITAWTNITVTRTWNDVTIDSIASWWAGWIETVKIAGEQIVW